MAQLLDFLKGGGIAFIGTLLTLAVTWLKDRNDDAKRSQRLDGATKYVQFWSAFYTTRIAQTPRDVHPWLKTQLDNHLARARDFVSVSASLPDVRSLATPPANKLRAWLLLYAPARHTFWLARLPYYYLGMAGPLVLIFNIFVFPFFYDPYLLRVELARNGLGVLLFSVVSAAVCLHLVSLPFRFLCVWLDRRVMKRRLSLLTLSGSISMG